ncbi:MAG: HDIG domain-containing protein [Caldisericia bacterium]|nr:HDIG domain-containing protein [Caldisericia bacterium]
MKILKIIRKKINLKINKEKIIIKSILTLIFFSFLFYAFSPPYIFVRKGTKLNKNLISPKNLEVIDIEKTQKEIEKALENVPIYYEYMPEIDKEVMNNINKILEIIESYRENQGNTLEILFESYGITFDLELLKEIKSKSNSNFIRFKNKILEITSNLLQSGVKESDLINLNDKLNLIIKDNDFNDNEKKITYIILEKILKPNLIINEDLTNKKREEIVKSIKPIIKIIKKGEIIFPKGTIITDNEIKILKEYNLLFASKDLFNIIFILILSLTISFILYNVIKINNNYRLKEKIFIILILFISILLGKFIKNVTLLPIFLISNLTILFFDIITSIIILLIVNIFYTLYFNDKFILIFLILFISIIFSLKTKKIINISDFLKIGSFVSLMYLIVYISIEFIQRNFDFSTYLLNSIYIALNPIISILILLVFVPYLEKILSITTPIGLVELLNINNPILKEFITRAPGSYQHSLNVSTLAQVAADAIGEDPLLAKVCAYYHDIGKLERPDFFIENNPQFNPHDSLSPSLSALIIISHVKEGVELAKKHNLPKIIVDTIKEHHGTTFVTYFYSKAKQIDPQIDESTFRYPGPIPSSKISGIIMLADSVEASVRGEKIEFESFSDFVNDVIDSKISDGQLNNSNLSFKDILKIKDSFIKTLTSMYHERISYVFKNRDLRERKKSPY